MEEKTRVDVTLYDLTVTAEEGDFYGKVRSKGKLNNQAIAARIKKEGTEYQLETLVEILNRADRIKAEGLASGYNINTLFVNASLGVNGVFYNTAFDPTVHKLNARVNPAILTRQLLASTKVNILGEAQTGVVIMSVTDHLTQSLNADITPNNAIVIAGERLKIEADADNEAQAGVFFVNTVDNTRTKSAQILSNKNKELIVMVPNLATGDYLIEIVSQFSGGTLLKSLRTETFETALTVN